jgi:thiamine-phosphate pyrophosphorylase
MPVVPQVDSRLRLILVTDGVGDLARCESIIEQAIAGGVRCVQLREPNWSARSMLLACERLMPKIDAVGGWLIVNDRMDVVATGMAHGGQVGHRSLPPDQARKVIGPHAILGYSAHDAEELNQAAGKGCNFALLSPVWATASKPGAPFLGARRAGNLTAAARLPVVWLGGVTPESVCEIGSIPDASRPVGVAVRSAIMRADDPMSAARSLLTNWPT